MDKTLTRIFFSGMLVLALSCKSSEQKGSDPGVQHDAGDVQDTGVEDVSKDVPAPDKGQDKAEKDDTGIVDVPHDTNRDTATNDTSAPTCQSGEKCYEGVGCAVVCTDQAQACLSEVSESERPNADALLDCISNSGCQDAGSVIEYEWFSECVEGKCKDNIDACFSGKGFCNDIRKCRMGCSPNDKACPLKCLGLATPDQREVWKDYYKCIMGADCVQEGNVMANGWPTDPCERYAQHHFCPKQTEACIPPQ